MSKIEIGVPIELKYSSRYFKQNRSFALKDIYDALVELITNSDDSYHRLFDEGKIKEDGGPILLEVHAKRGEPSIVRVKDRAEGLTLRQMLDKFGRVGDKTSKKGDRGFMARGAKDCTELGDMIIESIKDNKYYKCTLSKDATITPINDGLPVNPEIRTELGIPRGNGTSVTLIVDKAYKVPRTSNLVKDLPWHYSLRLLASEESPTKISIRKLNDLRGRPESIVYRQPEGQLVVDQEITVENYPDAKAHLKIWRSPEAHEGDRGRFRRSGILVKSSRAVLECSLLTSEFENDPLASKYFGLLECSYIDDLMEQFDSQAENSISVKQDNPRILIDPNRQQGLMRDHPFTNALFQVPTEVLRTLVANDREQQKANRNSIANDKTKEKLNQLAKVASQFLREQVEDNPEVSPDEESETESFFKKGIIVLPTYAKVSLGEEKKFWVYVNKDVIKGDPVGTVVSCDNEIIEPLDQIIQLQQHSKKENSFVGTFKVRAKKLTDSCVIQLKSKAFPLGEAIVEVVEPGLEIRDFISPLEFEHKSYSVEEGKSRILHLYAKYPEVISKSTSIKAWTTDDTNVAVRGSVTLDPVIGSNYARGDIRVEGRRIDSSAEIKAAVNGREAQATVKVKSKITKTVEMEIRIEDEDFGNFRARWADHDGKPNLLLISAKHESVRRYLGPPPEYAGQEGPIFRLLLAEIVAESVCRKVLGLEAKNKPWEFALRDLMSDQAIVDEVFSKLHRRFREFVGLAHRVMVGDIEISSS